MLRLYSNTWLYVPWVWPEHVEALDKTAFIDTKWGVWGSVMSYVPWHLHSLLKGGVKRLFGVVDQYSCVLGIKRCKLHGDTYLCKIAEPVSWSLDLCSFFGRGLAGPVMRVIKERVLRRKTVDIRKVEFLHLRARRTSQASCYRKWSYLRPMFSQKIGDNIPWSHWVSLLIPRLPFHIRECPSFYSESSTWHFRFLYSNGHFHLSCGDKKWSHLPR